jgi:biopolymer transport protein ExbD
MFDFENATERRHAPEPDLVPILDGLTAVIFFLLLSISFIGITKITMPPSVASVSSASNKTPVSGRVVAKLAGNAIQVKMEWIGNQPGEMIEKVSRASVTQKNDELVDAAVKLAQAFKLKFPEEKTIQIALASQLNYQELISIMDGFRKDGMYEDLVLSSYTEAD